MRGVMVVAALLLGMSHRAAALTEGLVDYVDSDCSEKLNTIYRTYYPAPVGTACVDILNRTLTETDPALCPSNTSAITCFNQQQTQWLAFVAECDVFHYADFNRGPVVPPGEGAPSSPSSSNSTSRRRSLLSSSSTSSSFNGTSAADYIAGVFYAAIAYDTSGTTVNNGCFPTMNVPSDFYSYLQGQPLSSAASARFASSAVTVMVAAAGAAAVLLTGI